jgi:acyl carrier protein
MKHTGITDPEICTIIGRAIGVSPSIVLPSTDLRRDLGLDSVGLLSIAFILEEQTGIEAFEYTQGFIEAQTVSDIIDIARRRG